MKKEERVVYPDTLAHFGERAKEFLAAIIAFCLEETELAAVTRVVKGATV
jgi:hypothetical protein